MTEVDRSNLFVYGTLKKGGKLHSVLGNSSEFLGVFKTAEDKFDMYDCGCPVMVLKDNGFKIKGELYKVTPECMARVTAVESGAGYVPFIVDVKDMTLSNELDYSKSLKTIAFIYPTVSDPYATMSSSDRIEKKGRVKEWHDK